MAQQFVTGPCEIYASYGTRNPSARASRPVFLGHCERGPRIQIRPQYTMVYVDLAGLRVPFDALYDGEDAIVSTVLSRWNENVYRLLAKKVEGDPVTLSGSRGRAKFNEIGSLMIQEGSAVTLWVYFPYSDKQDYDTMPAGYRFPAAFLQTDDLPELGTKPRKINLVWHCLRQIDFPDGNLDELKLTLFDHDMRDIENVSID